MDIISYFSVIILVISLRLWRYLLWLSSLIHQNSGRCPFLIPTKIWLKEKRNSLKGHGQGIFQSIFFLKLMKSLMKSFTAGKIPGQIPRWMSDWSITDQGAYRPFRWWDAFLADKWRTSLPILSSVKMAAKYWNARVALHQKAVPIIRRAGSAAFLSTKAGAASAHTRTSATRKSSIKCVVRQCRQMLENVRRNSGNGKRKSSSASRVSVMVLKQSRPSCAGNMG